MKLAKALETNLQATGQALAAGRISALHAKIIRESISLLPKDISDDQKREGETRLLELATQHDPKELRQLGIHLYETIDPEDAERRLGEQLERERKRAEQKRSITFSHSGPGLQSARVQLPVDEMARLKALLDPLARPQKTDANGPDTRTASRRLGDAFVELLDLALAAGEAPTRGGTKPQIIITMTLAQLVTGIGYATGQRRTNLSRNRQTPGLRRRRHPRRSRRQRPSTRPGSYDPLLPRRPTPRTRHPRRHGMQLPLM